jgi:hypothetical protein
MVKQQLNTFHAFYLLTAYLIMALVALVAQYRMEE